MEYQNSIDQLTKRAKYAKDNLRYLKENSNFLDDKEKKILKLIDAKKELKLSTDVVWLDMRRRLMDASYKQLRTLEAGVAELQTKLNAIQLKEAQEENADMMRTGGIPNPTEAEMEAVWHYLKTNPRMRRRLYGYDS